MKPILKATLITASISLTLFLPSCENETKRDNVEEYKQTKETAVHSGEHVFACPMHPEVIGKETDKCKKCGMALEHNDNAGKSDGLSYFMKYTNTPSEIEAGKEATLFFTPKIKSRENEEVPLKIVHEKKIHLIIASKDLAYFEHIHPEYQPDGSYQIKVLQREKNFTIGRGHNETKFDKGGEYILFADYSPSNGTHQLEKIPVTVKGKLYNPVTYTAPNLISKVDGLTISLESESGAWTTEQPMHIGVVIKKGNQVLDAGTFENYLGAKAHVIILKAESFDYLHVHPSAENGTLDLHTTFEKAGIYRGWLQFKTDGKLHTADFTIKVIKGKPGEFKTTEHHHDH
jgi:hypothetical protein